MKELIKSCADATFYSAKRLGLFRAEGIRILAYHATPGRPVGRERVFNSVSGDSLRAQFEVIKETGYKVIGLEDACGILAQGRKPESDHLVISFDDFFQNNFDVALPLLEEFGFKAVFFPVTSFLGRKENFPWVDGSEMYGPPGTSGMLREIHSLGHEVGSHGHSHIRLSELSEESMREDIEISRSILQEIIQAPVRLFCYPFGEVRSFNGTVKRKLRDMDFICALANLDGINPPGADLFAMRRTVIVDRDDPERFLKKLRGMRDWFYIRQAWLPG